MMVTLQKCHSSIFDDAAFAEEETSSAGGKDDAIREASWAGDEWATRDCLVLSFSAAKFAPQQVRRMAGVVAAVVSGACDLAYVDACFAADEMPTPLLPAGAVYLERVQLAQKTHKVWTNAADEDEAMPTARAPWPSSPEAAVLAAVRQAACRTAVEAQATIADEIGASAEHWKRARLQQAQACAAAVSAVSIS